LFVYGSLRSQADSVMSEVFRQSTEFINTGYMLGLLYDVADYPGAVVSISSTQKVYGELYKITRPALLIAQLDEYEECTDAYTQPHEYLRKIQTITLSDESQMLAWVYLYNHDVTQLRLIISGDFFNDSPA